MNKKIYALTTLERNGVEIDVRLFDTMKHCQKEYDVFIKKYETEIEQDQTIFASIQTHELYGVNENVSHFCVPFYAVIYGNQDGYYKNNKNLYL